MLVFPVNNRKDIASLWNEFFPRKKMRWEWDETGDNNVAELWQLRERLSISNQVVYSKWFRGPRDADVARNFYGFVECPESTAS